MMTRSVSSHAWTRKPTSAEAHGSPLWSRELTLAMFGVRFTLGLTAVEESPQVRSRSPREPAVRDARPETAKPLQASRLVRVKRARRCHESGRSPWLHSTGLGEVMKSLILFTALLLIASPLAGAGLAQEVGEGDSVFVPAPRELTRPIDLAWAALEEGRYAEAVDRFGQVLFSEERDNYFVPSETTPGLWSSLRVYQQQLLEKLPPDAAGAVAPASAEDVAPAEES